MSERNHEPQTGHYLEEHCRRILNDAARARVDDSLRRTPRKVGYDAVRDVVYDNLSDGHRHIKKGGLVRDGVVPVVEVRPYPKSTEICYRGAPCSCGLVIPIAWINRSTK